MFLLYENINAYVPGELPGRPQSRVLGWFLPGAETLAAWFGASFSLGARLLGRHRRGVY